LCLGSGERLPVDEQKQGFVELDATHRIYRYQPEDT
jgi:hypothetical protein